MKDFTFHVSLSNDPWRTDNRVASVMANTESEALGLVLEFYPEAKLDDVCSIKEYAQLKPLVVEEIVQDSWEC